MLEVVDCVGDSIFINDSEGVLTRWWGRDELARQMSANSGMLVKGLVFVKSKLEEFVFTYSPADVLFDGEVLMAVHNKVGGVVHVVDKGRNPGRSTFGMYCSSRGDFRVLGDVALMGETAGRISFGSFVGMDEFLSAVGSAVEVVGGMPSLFIGIAGGHIEVHSCAKGFMLLGVL